MGKNEIAPRPADVGRPGPLVPLLGRAIDIACNGLDEDGRLPSTHAPTREQMVALTARSGELNRALAPAEQKEVARMVAYLLAGFRSSGATDEKDARDTVNVYIAALNDLPLWAIRRACELSVKGEAGARDLRFAPSPPELRRAAKGEVEVYERERERLAKVLRAVEIGPAEPTAEDEARRVRLGEKLRKLADELGDGMRAPEPKTPLRRALEMGDDAAVQEALGTMWERPAQASASLLAKLAKPRDAA